MWAVRARVCTCKPKPGAACEALGARKVHRSGGHYLFVAAVIVILAVVVFAGDNDPLDVCEIGYRKAAVGEVYPVRLLCSL